MHFKSCAIWLYGRAEGGEYIRLQEKDTTG
nr:MAG TPA: Herpes virus U44 protein [Caudoviricetes sp.]